MRALIQRVRDAQVAVEGEIVGKIGAGLLVFLGVGPGDDEDVLEKVLQKISKLRIFEDEAGKMNRSLLDLGGELLIVSQFTLYADLSQGNRPSFTGSAPPAIAEPLYLRALARAKEMGIPTQGGRFGADMKVTLLNDGPVTLWLEQQP